MTITEYLEYEETMKTQDYDEYQPYSAKANVLATYKDHLSPRHKNLDPPLDTKTNPYLHASQSLVHLKITKTTRKYAREIEEQSNQGLGDLFEAKLEKCWKIQQKRNDSHSNLRRQARDDALRNINAIVDLGACVNIMSESMLDELSLADPKHANIIVEMTNKTRYVSQGIVENLLVKIDKFSFTSDFVIIDTKELNSKTIILGRPFLANIRAKINISTREVSLGIKEDRDNKLGGQIQEKILIEEQEDPEKCRETKERAIIRVMVNKLPEEWFSKVSRDKDDLEGIIDYLKPILYDGFIDYNDEAYKQMRNKLLGMPYTEPPYQFKKAIDVEIY
ncbi:reverse transcriptase domain-containing protein [Tanacetum coccineum]